MSEEPSAEVVRLHMEQLRSDLGQQMDETVEKARTLLNWRHYVRTYPWTAVAVAAAAGFMIAPRGAKRCRAAWDGESQVGSKGRGTSQSERTAMVEGGLAAVVANTVGSALTRGMANYLAQQVEKWVATRSAKDDS